MSASTLQRYAVTAFDYSLWRIVIEAGSRAEAIAKAQDMYALDSLGGTYAFEPVFYDLAWNAKPLVEEVQR
jgi:hypothetical protein